MRLGRSTGRLLSLMAGLVVAGFGGRAWAARPPARLALTWDAPAVCPPPSAVASNVERILADSTGLRFPSGAAVRAVVISGDPWQATLILDIGGTQTERRFEAESCEAIAAAAALIVALAIEDRTDAAPPPAVLPAVLPLRSVARPPGEKSPSPGGEGPTVATRLPLGPDAAGRLGPSRGFLTANGVVDWGTLPGAPAGGIEVAAGRRWAADRTRLRALASASYFPIHELAMAPNVGLVYADFWFASLSARGCAAAAIAHFEIGPCLGGELAAMHASSSVRSPPNELPTKTRPWFSALASMAASWNVSRATLVALRADVTVPTTRSTFVTTYGDGFIYQVPAISFRGAVGIEHSF